MKATDFNSLSSFVSTAQAAVVSRGKVYSKEGKLYIAEDGDEVQMNAAQKKNLKQSVAGILTRQMAEVDGDARLRAEQALAHVLAGNVPKSGMPLAELEAEAAYVEPRDAPPEDGARQAASAIRARELQAQRLAELTSKQGGSAAAAQTAMSNVARPGGPGPVESAQGGPSSLWPGRIHTMVMSLAWGGQYRDAATVSDCLRATRDHPECWLSAFETIQESISEYEALRAAGAQVVWTNIACAVAMLPPELIAELELDDGSKRSIVDALGNDVQRSPRGNILKQVLAKEGITAKTVQRALAPCAAPRPAVVPAIDVDVGSSSSDVTDLALSLAAAVESAYEPPSTWNARRLAGYCRQRNEFVERMVDICNLGPDRVESLRRMGAPQPLNSSDPHARDVCVEFMHAFLDCAFPAEEGAALDPVPFMGAAMLAAFLDPEAAGELQLHPSTRDAIKYWFDNTPARDPSHAAAKAFCRDLKQRLLLERRHDVDRNFALIDEGTERQRLLVDSSLGADEKLVDVDRRLLYEVAAGVDGPAAKGGHALPEAKDGEEPTGEIRESKRPVPGAAAAGELPFSAKAVPPGRGRGAPPKGNARLVIPPRGMPAPNTNRDRAPPVKHRWTSPHHRGPEARHRKRAHRLAMHQNNVKQMIRQANERYRRAHGMD
jgi:hypothetical protein